MGEVKQVNIKNQTYYFFNDIINIEEFDSNLPKIYRAIYGVDPLYLIIGKVDGQIEKENQNKYLVYDSTDEKKEVLKKHTELWDEIKNEIETINDGKEGEGGKDFMKIKFDTDDNLPLNMPLKLHLLIIIVRCVFGEDGEFYPQLCLDECLYEL